MGVSIGRGAFEFPRRLYDIQILFAFLGGHQNPYHPTTAGKLEAGEEIDCRLSLSHGHFVEV